jgi:hypothetical protein
MLQILKKPLAVIAITYLVVIPITFILTFTGLWKEVTTKIMLFNLMLILIYYTWTLTSKVIRWALNTLFNKE